MYPLYLADLGIAQPRGANEYAPDRPVGTAVFASRGAHAQEPPCPGHDLESLAYTLIYMCDGLPWSRAAHQDIPRMKNEISPDELCAKVPRAIFKLLSVALNLKFGDKPDYGELLREFAMDFLTVTKMPLNAFAFQSYVLK